MNLAKTLLVGMLLAQPQAPGTAPVEGTIRKSGSSDTISGAGVELRSVSDDNRRYTAASDSAGRFRLESVLPGQYRIAASHPGYVRAEFGQHGIHGTGITFTVTAGLGFKDVVIALPETGAISGRIYNRDGLPMENVQVQALAYKYKDGRRILTTVRAAVSNDLGAYRLFWLPPGEYFIGATPLSTLAPNLIRESEPYGAVAVSSVSSPTGKPIRLPTDEPGIPSYFPGVADAQLAAAVTVKSGANLEGIDITFRPGTLHAVSGVVMNLPNASSAPAASLRTMRVRLEPRGPIKIENGGTLRSIDSTSGAFEFADVLPGAYDLCANAGALQGCVPIDVGESDITGIRIPLIANLDVRARVSFERLPGFDEASALSRLKLSTFPAGTPDALRQPSGEFLIRGITPGSSFRIRMESLPENGYLKSVGVGDLNAIDGIRLDRVPENPIEIVVGLNGGSAEGSVSSKPGLIMAGITVVAVPETTRERVDLYREAQTDTAGRFRISGLAAGDYKVFAFEDVENGAWWDAEFVRSYENQGKSIHVREGAEQTIQLISIP